MKNEWLRFFVKDQIFGISGFWLNKISYVLVIRVVYRGLTLFLIGVQTTYSSSGGAIIAPPTVWPILDIF